MSGQQQSPSRPAVRRHSSQVRFSRGDRSPIGTLTSEESSQGDSGTLRGRAQAPSHTRGHSDFNDINTYPVASETSHSGYTNPYYNSEADETELDTRSQRDSAQSSETIVAADHNRGGLRDSYTSTPPRIQTRRATNPTNMVPPSDKRQDISTPPATMRGNGPMNLPTGGRPSMATPPAPAPYVEEMLSPKSMPSEWGSPASQWQPQPPSPSPARPPSALKQTSASPIPTGPPIPGSTAGFMGQGFRQFDQPGPIYAPPPFPPSTPAASHEPIAPQQGTDPGSEPRFSLREWQEYQQRQQWAQNVGRHDSDETLTGGYPVNTEKPSVPRGSEAMHLEPVGPNEQTGMRRRTTREVEGNDEVHHVKGGVFSQLLRLAGRSNTLKNRNMSIGASSQGTSGELPIMENLGIRSRANSFTSTIFPMDELEPDDPRVTGKKPKPKDPNWDDLAYVQTTGVVRKRKGSIQLHVAGETRVRFALADSRHSHPPTIHLEARKSIDGIWSAISSGRIST
ncbi:hypothetical protein BD324DRAFT_270409 [Kockovaella imperatae]|uniref:Uncharacterized protein n=1 Tax=Kockovaella imperatae TaxID=4999 RepID=A0A1Y1US25_9TREE|nr:hypothetical protein BD324DRAFT_270409 [Kockovaella imperatae]ORX40266.1 hypothetical protein BD324DRAFT_270409 [Kockovaella imperatae]